MTCSNASRRARSALALALTCAVWFVTGAHRTQAAGVVGTGSTASCTDTALNTALTGGGLVTFNCGGGPVTIDISPGAGGTFTKTISANTTIDGGSLITISGGHSVGVFYVNVGVDFTVQNLTIARGGNTQYGGGIANHGTLTVTNSTISDNHAYGGGGIFNGGTLTVIDSTFSRNGAGGGGGIANFGTLTVTSSTFSDNSAGGDGGGGIFNFGTVTVTSSPSRPTAQAATTAAEAPSPTIKAL